MTTQHKAQSTDDVQYAVENAVLEKRQPNFAAWR